MLRTTEAVQCIWKQGEPAVLLARITDAIGTRLNQDSVSAISYTIFDLAFSGAAPIKAPLSVSACIFNSLQLDGRWSVDNLGFNLAVVLPGTSFPNYSPDQRYRVEIELTALWDNTKTTIEWYGPVRRILSTPLQPTPPAPGNAASLRVTTSASAQAGQAFSITLAVLDPNGVIVPGYRGTVLCSSTDGQAVLPATYTFTASDAGSHTFTGAILRTAGSQTVTFTDSLISGTATVSVSADALSRLAFSQQPSAAAAGNAISPAVSVRLLDAFGNLTASTATVTLTAAGPGAFTGGSTTTVNAVAGIATFNNLALTLTGSYVLTASTPSATSGVSSAFSISAGAANQLAFGQQPTGTLPNAAIAPAPTVQIQDAFGNLTASSATITMTATGPGAFTGGSTTAVAAVAGVATFNNLLLATSGPYTIQASSGGLGSATSLPFSIGSNVPTHYVLIPLPTSNAAGTSFALTVNVLDANNNIVTWYTGTLHFTTTDTGTGVVLPANYAFTAADAGSHTFRATLVTASTPTITATDVANAGISGSVALTITPAAPYGLAFGQQPTAVTAGTVLAPAITLRILDAYGNLTASGATVTVAANGLGGFTPGSTTGVVATSGLAVFSNLTLNTAGTYTIAASGAGLSGATSLTFTVNAAAAAKLAFGQPPTNAVAGVALAPTPTVRIQDAFGNLTASTASVAIAANGPAGFTGGSTTTVNAVAGVASFSNLILNSTGSYTATATSAGLTAATSPSFAIQAAASSKLAFVQQPTNATAGVALSPSPSLQIQDAFGNLTASTLTITMSASGPGAFTGGSTTTVAAVAGVATFGALTLNTTGSYTASATGSGLTGATSNSFAIAAAAASKLVFAQQPSTTTAGIAISPSPTVQIQDAFGNLTASTANVTLAASGPGAFTGGSTTVVAAIAGVATFGALTLNTSGTYTVNATGTSLAGGSSASFNVLAAAAASLSVTGPSSSFSNTAFTVVVAAKDAFGNTAPSYRGIAHFTSSDNAGGVVLPSNYTFTATDAGVHSFGFAVTLQTNGAQAVTATDTITGSINGQLAVTISSSVASPRILLTDAMLTAKRAMAVANTAQWQSFTGSLNYNLLNPISAGYQGNTLDMIPDYALAYLALLPSNPAAAANYADKAIAIMKSGSRDYQRTDNSCVAYLARGDGATKNFTIPNADFNPSSPNSFLPYLANVHVAQVTKGSANGLDLVNDGGNNPITNAKWLKVSNSYDGSADYAQTTGWKQSTTIRGGIDWGAGGTQPANGATYYVTYADGFEVLGSALYPWSNTWTLSGTTLSMVTAPATGQLLFCRYAYGTHSSDGSTLAYQQTSFGVGGQISAYIDAGYTGRYLGKNLALGLDWLDGYVGLTSALKAEFMAVLVQWFDWLSAYGYNHDTLFSNYGAGDYLSNICTALALKTRDATNGTRLMTAITNFRAANVPTFTTDTTRVDGNGGMGLCSHRGGYWSEGWSYGEQACKDILLAGLAWEVAGQANATMERAFASDVVAHLVHAQPAGPNTTSMYDGGDWYQYPAWFMHKELFYVLAAMADDPSRANYANYIIQNYPPNALDNSDQANNWEDILYHDTAATTALWTTSLTREWRAGGTGLVTARSDWTNTATWLSFLMGNMPKCDHQDYTPAKLQIQRGTDDLLVNVGAVAEVLGQGRSLYGNTVRIDDNGDGVQTYRYSMGTWYGIPGVVMDNYEAAAPSLLPLGYVYAGGDYHNAYSPAFNAGNTIGSVSELHRSIVYVRPNYVFVYDRITTVKASYPKQLSWHTINVPTLAGNAWTVSVNASRLFGQTYSSVPLNTFMATYPNLNGSGRTVYQVVTTNTNAIAQLRLASALQVATTATATMDASVRVASTDARMEGVLLGNVCCLFGAQGDVNPATPIAYSITYTGLVTHILVNMAASRSYAVTAGGSGIGSFTSTANGVLVFQTTAAGAQAITVT